MESNRAVLGMLGDGPSGMCICIVVQAMKATCKYVEVLLVFAGYQQHSLMGLTVVLHRQECIQTDVDPCSGWSAGFGSSIHQAPSMLPQ